MEKALPANREKTRKVLLLGQEAPTLRLDRQKRSPRAASVFFLPTRLMSSMARRVPGNSANVVQITSR